MTILVHNAGLVLASAYLPRLWHLLDLSVGAKFGDSAAGIRAAHLLDYLVFGSAQPLKPFSKLNALLCGLPIGAHADGSFESSTKERELVDGLLLAMITHWSAIGHTSIAGLRETFLQREGRLEHQGDSWILTVHPGPFDMLLDCIPWGFSTCKHPWMKDTLRVEWR